MNEYARTVISLICLTYQYLQIEKRTYLVLDSNQLDYKYVKKSVLDFLSIDINAYIPYNSKDKQDRNNNVDYRIFRAKPIIKICNGKYLIYSPPILIERLYNSLFFDLKDYFKGDPFEFYNKNFIEHKLFQSNILKCIGENTSYFFPTEKNIRKEKPIKEIFNQPDFYIRENNSIILFECKAIKLNGELKDRNSVDEFLNALKNKLYLSTINTDSMRHKKKQVEKVGVTQLVELIKMIDCNNTCKWDVNIPKQVTYYPVLVLEDSRIVSTGISSIINTWYKELIYKELIGKPCLPIIVTSIKTIIKYAEIFKSMSFHKIFDKYFTNAVKCTGDKTVWNFSYLADFDMFMRENYKVDNEKQKICYNNIIKNIFTD